MTTTARTVTEIFADARFMHIQALERLEAGDIRDAAEKAWCATRRATDALILARTGYEPERVPETTRALRDLALRHGNISHMVGRYCSTRDILHGDCFYLGLCEPIEDTKQRIQETAAYIDDAERLAGVR